MASKVHSVALVGASGNLGSLVLKYLLEAERFRITILTRSDSNAKVPNDASITIKKGSYESPEFLKSALVGIDVLVLTLHWTAVPETEIKLIEAAVSAGVKWILPTEFGSDLANEDMLNAVPMHASKTAPRVRVEELGSCWVGVVTNPWFDFSMKLGMFGIDVQKKTAHLLNGGTARFNTTTLSTVALAIVRLLSLPITTESGTSLSDFKNQFVYISSFLTSQRDILDEIHRVTKDSDKDWTITNGDAQQYIEEGKERMAKGDFNGMAKVLYGAVMKGDMGGDYESSRGVSNKVLGLPKENLYNAVQGLL